MADSICSILRLPSAPILGIVTSCAAKGSASKKQATINPAARVTSVVFMRASFPELAVFAAIAIVAGRDLVRFVILGLAVDAQAHAGNRFAPRWEIGVEPNFQPSLRPLWCQDQDHLPSLEGTYEVTNSAQCVLLSENGVRVLFSRPAWTTWFNSQKYPDLIPVAHT